jgi:hypothetical protein
MQNFQNRAGNNKRFMTGQREGMCLAIQNLGLTSSSGHPYSSVMLFEEGADVVGGGTSWFSGMVVDVVDPGQCKSTNADELMTWVEALKFTVLYSNGEKLELPREHLLDLVDDTTICVCDVCKGKMGPNDDRLVCCDGCNVSTHVKCLSEPMKRAFNVNELMLCAGCEKNVFFINARSQSSI